MSFRREFIATHRTPHLKTQLRQLCTDICKKLKIIPGLLHIGPGACLYGAFLVSVRIASGNHEHWDECEVGIVSKAIQNDETISSRQTEFQNNQVRHVFSNSSHRCCPILCEKRVIFGFEKNMNPETDIGVVF